MLVKLTKRGVVAKNSIRMIFETEETFKFIPGQHIGLSMRYNDKDFIRYFSLANKECKNRNLIEIIISNPTRDPVTNLISKIPYNTKIEMSGPFGKFRLVESTRKFNYLMIATGSAISCYRSMLNKIEKFIIEKDYNFTLIIGSKDRDYTCYADEFASLARKYPEFRYKLCYSRTNLKKLNEFEYYGYIQEYLRKVDISPKNDIIYLCGHKEMVVSLATHFYRNGFEKEDVFYEKSLDKIIDRELSRRKHYTIQKHVMKASCIVAQT